MTEDDLSSYSAEWVEPAAVHLSSLGMTFYSMPPPGSGAIMAYILNILDNYNIQPEDDGPLLYHRYGQLLVCKRGFIRNIYSGLRKHSSGPLLFGQSWEILLVTMISETMSTVWCTISPVMSGPWRNMRRYLTDLQSTMPAITGLCTTPLRTTARLTYPCWLPMEMRSQQLAPSIFSKSGCTGV